MKYNQVESKILELKEKLTDYSRLIETITAFSNTQGGTIIIGIRNSDREIIGLPPEEIAKYHEEIPQVVVDAISPQIAIDLYEQSIGEKVCLTIRVFPGPQKPYFIKRYGSPNGVYLRFGTHNRKADSYAVQEFSRMKTGIRFEQEPCGQISYSDLSQQLLRQLFPSINESVLIGSGYGVTEVSGRVVPNVAGTLLFYPAHREIIPESVLTVAVYAGKDKENLIKTETFHGGLVDLLEAAYTYIKEMLGTHYELTGLIKKPIDFEIPLVAIREVLINAVAHRAYDYEAPVKVSVFSDRIEVINPGNFYAPINPDNLKEGLSRYRNPLISDALRKTGHMEKQGIGIGLIISSCLKAGLVEPEFLELEHHVKIVLFRKKHSLVSQSATDQTPSEIERMRRYFAPQIFFTSAETAEYLGKSQALAKKRLQQMQQQGEIEMVGKGPATRYRFIKEN
jgi:ATP-dependent DNA helicase RecG